MKNQILTLAIGTMLGISTLIAAPQAPEQNPPPAQNTQPAGRHQADPNQQVRRLTKKLNLTADQQNQLLPILADRQQQIANLMNDGSLAPKDRHTKMRAIREDSDSKINSVLTDTQKQTYAQMEQQMRERAQQHREQNQNGK